MDEILQKLSSYNIFNYLLPGTLFAVVGETYSSFRLVQDDLLIAVFFYYFLGLVISRIGSLLIEPFLKAIRFVEFADYTDFVAASKIDKKLDVLSEANNMYRTLISLFTLLIILSVVDLLSQWWPTLRVGVPYALLPALLVLFLFSYRKQTNYVVKRVTTERDNQ